MKNQLILWFTLLSFSALLMTSCEEDGTILPGPGLSPSIRLVGAQGFISTSTTVESGTLLQFRVTAAPGDDPLELLTITENGSNVNLGRITYESGSSFASNPAQVLGAIQQGFTEDILIDGPTSPGNYEYTFTVRDAAQIISTTSVTVTVELIAPTLIITDSTSTISAGPSEIVRVNLSALQGTGDLSTITVFENETLMDASRLSFDNNGTLSAFLANPEFTPNISSFDATLAIEVASVVDSNLYNYRIELTDTEGLQSSATLSVLVENTLDTTYTGVLVYNRDGQQFGGLNLYTGEAVAFNSADAQIRDLGIDLNLPNATNWLRQIRAVNGAMLRAPGNSQPEGFSFENIRSRDALVAAFDAGTDIGDSEAVQVGDIFLVQNTDDYFILLVTDVVVTENDNNDYYEFEIKKSEM